MLSPHLYEELRPHYRRSGPQTGRVAVPRRHACTPPIPHQRKVVWHACRRAAQRCGVKKPLHPHTLRHYAASRTMPRVDARAADSWAFESRRRGIVWVPCLALWESDKPTLHLLKNY